MMLILTLVRIVLNHLFCQTQPVAVNFTMSSTELDRALKAFPMLSTAAYMLNITLSTDEKDKNFIFNEYIIFYLKGDSVAPIWRNN
jgi:hypothetical protein